MVQLLDSEDEVVDAGAVRAVLPLVVVADAVDFVVEADGAADCHVGLEQVVRIIVKACFCFIKSRLVGRTYLGRPLDAVSQQLNAVGAVVASGALVELVEVDGMLEGAVFDEGAFGDVGVVLGQAHDEAEVDLGVGIQLAGAEFDDIAYALGGTVLAIDTAVGSGPECQLLAWMWMLDMVDCMDMRELV